MKKHYSLAVTLASLAAFHPVTKAPEKIIEASAFSVFQEYLLASAVLLMLLGSLLVLRTLSPRWLPLQKILELLTWCIIIALTGALGNIGQVWMTTVYQDNRLGLITGGAIGGLVAACGGGIIYLLDKTPQSHRIFVGVFLLFLGLSLELIQIILLISTLQ